jgi:hypothetical protein
VATQEQVYKPAGQFATSLGPMNGMGSIVLRGELPPDKTADALLATVRSIDPPSVDDLSI